LVSDPFLRHGSVLSAVAFDGHAFFIHHPVQSLFQQPHSLSRLSAILFAFL